MKVINISAQSGKKYDKSCASNKHWTTKQIYSLFVVHLFALGLVDLQPIH